MPRDNRCMYMEHVCFSDCVGVCGNVCCVAAVVCLCRGCDGCCVFLFVL